METGHPSTRAVNLGRQLWYQWKLGLTLLAFYVQRPDTFGTGLITISVVVLVILTDVIGLA